MVIRFVIQVLKECACIFSCWDGNNCSFPALRVWSSLIDNPRPNYREQNPPNPKIGQKYHPDIQIPLQQEDRQNTPKMPGKYPQNTNFVFLFWIPGGYLKEYFRESGVFLNFWNFLFCSWSMGSQLAESLPLEILNCYILNSETILDGINSVHTRCIVKTSGFTRGLGF